MGKKNRKTGSHVQTLAAGSLSRTAKKEVLEISSQLMDKCIKPLTTGPKEWEEFLEIYSLVEKLREKQKDLVLPYRNRKELLPQFLQWLQDNNVDMSKIAIEDFSEFGFGLKATTDLQEADLFLTIPRKLMMTTETAKKSQMGLLIEEDKILQAMPNIVLAMHVLCEARNPDSFWQPYIKCLPATYSTALYFNLEELQMLKGSPLLSEVLNQYRTIARQYAYFYKLLQNNHFASRLPIRERFTYDDYRWAVSTVMTRQNQIPVADGAQVTNALIPLWDMCNHCNGQISTDFDLNKDSGECYAMVDFKEGEQIFIFYGTRSNAELLLHNGFVYPDNLFDVHSIKLGISKSDPLYGLKCQVLSKLGMVPSRSFLLQGGSLPVSKELLTFLRVICMDEANLTDLFSDTDDLLSQMGNDEIVVSIENEQKTWAYLETRVRLLLHAYPTTMEEDEDLYKQQHFSKHSQLALEMRLCEKRILNSTLKYAQEKVQSVLQRFSGT